MDGNRAKKTATCAYSGTEYGHSPPSHNYGTLPEQDEELWKDDERCLIKEKEEEKSFIDTISVSFFPRPLHLRTCILLFIFVITTCTLKSSPKSTRRIYRGLETFQSEGQIGSGTDMNV
ncbi:hypothetical protein E1B28_005578 [Marasmius oreades]|uniref:Uncharacterized protein n=1 Tax=Marasmius oreades TaxID=181124 RepID=A0A9P7S461_9AGAR|nr:uncharacterized protein E1B28_005578 [Marasmius oreades]KAG7094762.1 hypothetical protein E1B28_005578 [Marasmius oreades]